MTSNSAPHPNPKPSDPSWIATCSKSATSQCHKHERLVPTRLTTSSDSGVEQPLRKVPAGHWPGQAIHSCSAPSQ